MKKILVLSDSHGNVNNMIYAVRKEQPDLMIHLGDCCIDAEKLQQEFPEIPMEQVPGNCDISQIPAEKIIELEGLKVLLCHGHAFNVKSNLLALELGARERGVDMVLFGHTHRVFYDWHNGLRMLNPGSIGSPGYDMPPSYGILLMDQETNQVDMKIAYIEIY